MSTTTKDKTITIPTITRVGVEEMISFLAISIANQEGGPTNQAGKVVPSEAIQKGCTSRTVFRNWYGRAMYRRGNRKGYTDKMDAVFYQMQTGRSSLVVQFATQTIERLFPELFQ